MQVVLRWLPALVIAGVIFWLSSIPDLHVTAGWGELVLRKGAHIVIYALLAAACLRGSRDPRTAFALAVAYAAFDELHQSFVEGRVGTPVDVLIDAVGILAGIAAVQRFARIQRVVLA